MGMLHAIPSEWFEALEINRLPVGRRPKFTPESEDATISIEIIGRLAGRTRGAQSLARCAQLLKALAR